MFLSNFVRPLALTFPVVLGISSCATTTEQAESVHRVDDLSTQIERVQAEALVGKESAHTALAKLETLVSPSFSGDAAKSYAALVTDIERSERQAKTLLQSVAPMSESAEALFHRWTLDLESFGNTRMRQRSQTRLDETRTRYSAVLHAAQSAQISFDAFNADLRDSALFLGNDLNAGSVAAIAAEVTTLKDQVGELEARLETCANSARDYVAATALYGQVETVAPENDSTAPTTDKKVTANDSNLRTQPNRRRNLAPAKQRTTPSAETTNQPPVTPTTEVVPNQTPTTDPAPAPVNAPEVTPQPAPASGATPGTTHPKGAL